MPFKFEETDLPGLTLISPQRFDDPRGAFWEMYRASAFAASGLPDHFRQVNLSRSKKHVLRGLHYQLQPHAQGKLISVLRGEIYDVSVDLRLDSPSYRSWRGFRLSESSRRMVYIPEGFAHGFQALSGDVIVSYHCTAEYAPEFEAGVRWDDPELNIPWPLTDPLVNDRDRSWPGVHEAQANFVFGEGTA